MQRGVHTKDVVKCLVAISVGEPVRVAGKERFSDEEVAAESRGRVPVRTVENWWIQCLGDVLDGCVCDCGEVNT